mmetsp:Transcript_19077/g.26668  ORF Transcript_19077/g.26668 Transcript_19077/m.26668 type:complete len:81 (-) Transcript_19077:296-538(-)
MVKCSMDYLSYIPKTFPSRSGRKHQKGERVSCYAEKALNILRRTKEIHAMESILQKKYLQGFDRNTVGETRRILFQISLC